MQLVKSNAFADVMNLELISIDPDACSLPMLQMLQVEVMLRRGASRQHQPLFFRLFLNATPKKVELK